MFYLYRTTTDKLEQHLNDIVAAGDTVFAAQFTGGRDWVIIGRRGGEQ